MSIIIYQEDILYSDSQGEYVPVHGREPQTYEADKIHKSPCGRLAVAYVGNVLSPEKLSKLIDALLAAALSYSLTGTFADAIEDDSEMFLSDDIYFLAITTEVCFSRYGRGYRELNPKVHHAYGSVETSAIMLLEAGYTPAAAIEWLCKRRSTVGKRVASCRVSDLEPLTAQSILTQLPYPTVDAINTLVTLSSVAVSEGRQVRAISSDEANGLTVRVDPPLSIKGDFDVDNGEG